MAQSPPWSRPSAQRGASGTRSGSRPRRRRRTASLTRSRRCCRRARRASSSANPSTLANRPPNRGPRPRLRLYAWPQGAARHHGADVRGAQRAGGHRVPLLARTRNVHHVAGPVSWYVSRERISGWRRTVRAPGVADVTPFHGDGSAASGYQAGRDLVRVLSVTAVFAANDEMAIGVIRAMTEAGRSVRGDVSVIGHDDVPTEPTSCLVTTVRYPSRLERRRCRSPGGRRSSTPRAPASGR